jgi:DNA (cytosine-5)-methyltransferase 1
MNIASFFAGAGGLDLGFEKAGFNVTWANEYDPEIWETYESNHPNTVLDRRSLSNISSSEVGLPNQTIDGIIGGPPCQSWSEAGSLRGIKDSRGQLFFEFIRIIADLQPKFFLAENVSGMLLPTHQNALRNIKALFQECGYNLSFELLNASDYGVPQDRKRVFFIGYRTDLDLKFKFPRPITADRKITLKQAIGDLQNSAVPGLKSNYTNVENCLVPNHEYMIGGFSSMFMSRNRVRSWDEVSYTIQAGGRHAPLHPQAPKMPLVSENVRAFESGKEHLYRRLSVRECARIQTFPDDFIFKYRNLAAAYKMIGNAVPVNLAKIIAQTIMTDLKNLKPKPNQVSLNHSVMSGEMVRQMMVNIVNASV